MLPYLRIPEVSFFESFRCMEHRIAFILREIDTVFRNSYALYLLIYCGTSVYKIQLVRIFSMGKYHFNSPYRHTSGHGISPPKTGGDEKPGGYSI